MIKRIFQLLLISCLPFGVFAQNMAKKTLGHEELVTWKSIKNTKISNDGNCVVYELKGEETDGVLKIYNPNTDVATTISRGERAKISADSRYVFFKIKTAKDTVRMMRRNKIKKPDLPKDTLGIFDVVNRTTEYIPTVKSFKVPEKWAGVIIYQKEAEEIAINLKLSKDTSDTKDAKPKKKAKKPKKENGNNGTKLVIRNLKDNSETVFPYVVNYELAEKGEKVLFQTTGNDSTYLNGLYLYVVDKQSTKPLIRKEGDFKRMILDEKGDQIAFLANFDTTNALIPPFELGYWKEGMDSAKIIANNSRQFLPKDWIISEHETPKFSKDGGQLFFGMAPPPILEDTTLLEDEIAKVEVWH